MLTEKEAFANLMARAKPLVMESFDFDKAVETMLAVNFGWVRLHSGEHKRVARTALEELIDHAIETALALVEKGEPWGSCWTSSAGFIVFVFDSGMIQAHMSLVNSDSYDYDELLPLCQQLDIARGGSGPAPSSFDCGGRQRRILLLNE